MDKKTVVVIGSGAAIGNHVAEVFAKKGFRAVLVARSKEKLDGYVKEFQKKGYEAYAQIGDAADAASLKAVFDSIGKQFGKIDVLVYNAAILEGGTPSSLSGEELMRHYQVDVASALDCVKQVLPKQLSTGEGTILFTGGGLALHPVAEYACVSMGKAALRALAFTLHQELKEKGIFTGIVTIMGNVVSGTHYDPALIAEKYWKLYTEREACEYVYKE